MESAGFRFLDRPGKVVSDDLRAEVNRGGRADRSGRYRTGSIPGTTRRRMQYAIRHRRRGARRAPGPYRVSAADLVLVGGEPVGHDGEGGVVEDRDVGAVLGEPGEVVVGLLEDDGEVVEGAVEEGEVVGEGLGSDLGEALEALGEGAEAELDVPGVEAGLERVEHRLVGGLAAALAELASRGRP